MSFTFLFGLELLFDFLQPFFCCCLGFFSFLNVLLGPKDQKGHSFITAVEHIKIGNPFPLFGQLKIGIHGSNRAMFDGIHVPINTP